MSDTPKKTAANILVPNLGPLHGFPGAWSTPAKDVIKKLQESHGALGGGGKRHHSVNIDSKD